MNLHCSTMFIIRVIVDFQRGVEKKAFFYSGPQVSGLHMRINDAFWASFARLRFCRSAKPNTQKMLLSKGLHISLLLNSNELQWTLSSCWYDSVYETWVVVLLKRTKLGSGHIWVQSIVFCAFTVVAFISSTSVTLNIWVQLGLLHFWFKAMTN